METSWEAVHLGLHSFQGADGNSVERLAGARPRSSVLGVGSAPRSAWPRLLDLIGTGRGLGPFTAPIGLDASGRTVWHDLHSPTARHLIVSGADADRFEALRSVAAALALTTRPALLQTLAIDTTGRELLFLSSLPHTVLETAIDPAGARLSLSWLGEELNARRQDGRSWPSILLVVDDLTTLQTRRGPGTGRAVDHILRHGGSLGVHLLAGTSRVRRLGLRTGLRRCDLARLTAAGQPGVFDYRRGKTRVRLTGARLSAWDLDLVIRGRATMPAISEGRREDPHSSSLGNLPRQFERGAP